MKQNTAIFAEKEISWNILLKHTYLFLNLALLATWLDVQYLSFPLSIFCGWD